MKLNRILFAAAVLAFASCTMPREEMGVELGEQSAVELNVEIPTMSTRATTGTNSENGGLTNVDWGTYDLRYTIEIYDETGNTLAFSDVKYDTGGYTGYSNSIALTKGRDYKLYVWADFVKAQGQDLHYVTDDLRNISFNGTSYIVNDESRDAYAYCGVFSVAEGAANNISATLQRPFAKLRLVTTDANNLSFDQQIGSIKVSYIDSTVATSYSLTDGTLGTATTVTDVTADCTLYSNEASTGANYGERTLLTDYIFAPATGQSSVKVALTIFDTDDNLIYTIPTKELPIEKNKLTSVEGAALTGTANLTVSINGDITEFAEGSQSF